MMRAALMIFGVLMAHFLHHVECESSVGGGVGGAGDRDHGSSASLSASSRRGDLCSSCRGDNSTCRAVSGIFSRPQLNVGYNLVAHIPKGACNLSITEIRKSPNHLALQRRDGSFIFNGEWRLSQSGEYHDAGASIYYRRQDLKSLESINSPGPINEPLDLMVLYQQPNPVIRYEYLISIPPAALLAPEPHYQQLGEAATSRPASYIPYPLDGGRIQSGPSPSSLSILQQPQQHPALLTNPILNPYNSIPPFPPKPSGGQELPQGPSLYPGDPYTNSHLYSRSHQVPPGRRHDHTDNRPSKHGVSGITPNKKFSWKVTYSNCTEPCGGGLSNAIVRCVRNPAGNPVGDRRCNTEEKPAPQPIRCNVKPCPAEWVIGDWSSCNAECGEGFKTRSVLCRQKVSSVLTMQVAEGACLQKKPNLTQPCQIRPCNFWQTSPFSACSAPCGSGIRKRTLACVSSNGEIRINSDCDENEKPPEITPCNMSPCEGVDWFVSEFSECSQSCGTGVQTRHVVCSSIKQQHLKSYYLHSQVGYHNHSRSNYLKKSRKFPTSSEIETNLIVEDEDLTSADTTPFTDIEEMEDLRYSSLETQVSCDESRRPVNERECFSDRSCAQPVWFTGEWGECSSSCENGLQTRQVLCVQFSRGKFKVSSDSLCRMEEKPVEKQPCTNSDKCPQRWFTTEWSECSALCGGGTQKRYVSCRASNWTLPSSLCFDKDRPVERHSCNEHKCTLTPGPPTQSTTPIPNESEISRDKPPKSPNSSGSFQENRRPSLPSYTPDMNEEADERNCTDQYRNCALVVQARLCRYKYYRSVCCRSCSDTL